MPDFFQPLYVLSGLCVGFLVGMTGVGGGSLMTPLLILVFKVHPLSAVGTDLLYAAVTKSVGTIVHGRRGSVNWRVVLRLASGSIPGTLLTLALLHHFGSPSRDASRLITLSLGVALLVTAPSILFRRQLQDWSRHKAGSMSENTTHIVTVLFGLALGIMVSISSVGAGAIGMVVLLLLYPKLPTATIVGSDIAHAVPLTLIAGMGHWAMGDVNTLLLTSLLTGSIPGIVLGSLCVGRVSERIQRGVLATVLTVVGARLL